MSVGASWLLISGSCVAVTVLGWLLSRWLIWIWRTYQIRCEIRESELQSIANPRRLK